MPPHRRRKSVLHRKIHSASSGQLLIIRCTSNDLLQKIADANNLTIEYLFERDSLQKEVDGKKLKFDPIIKVTLITNIKIESDPAVDAEWYYAKVSDDSKVDFAYKVVPTLEPEAFENFHMLFSMVKEIVKETE